MGGIMLGGGGGIPRPPMAICGGNAMFGGGMPRPPIAAIMLGGGGGGPPRPPDGIGAPRPYGTGAPDIMGIIIDGAGPPRPLTGPCKPWGAIVIGVVKTPRPAARPIPGPPFPAISDRFGGGGCDSACM